MNSRPTVVDKENVYTKRPLGQGGHSSLAPSRGLAPIRLTWTLQAAAVPTLISLLNT